MRALPEDQWLPQDDRFGDHDAYQHQLDTKAALCRDRHHDVFAALPDTEDAGAEALALIKTHLAEHHQKSASPSAEDAQDLHPLDRAARLIPEDLLLLAPRPSAQDGAGDHLEWVLVAASLCFPAHWVLAEKMGLPLAAIHAPVPHYKERLETPMDRFFTNMKVGPISTRMNWSLQLEPELFAPHRSARPAAMGDIVDDRLTLRVESQSLRKLPRSGVVLFTIRTHLVPLQYWRHVPGAIEDLVQMLSEMSPETRDYKGAGLYEDALRMFIHQPDH